MVKEKNNITVVEEKIIKRIVLLRDEKVILDVHLSELYGVETRALKQAVRRNIDRFPKDFMFTLTGKGIESVVSQNVIPHKKYLGGARPFAFTETGVAMLSSVLNSRAAIKMNIAIMRTFVALRKVTINYQEIMRILTRMRGRYDKQFKEVFAVLEQLVQPPRERIGFRRSNEREEV